MDERFERAWAAGFFDGEGWAARTGRGVQARINQADPDGVPEVLERFQRAVGCGRIRGPERKPGRIDIYKWYASSRVDLERTYSLIDPWLGPMKRAQFAAALRRELEAPPEDLADPTWRAWAAGFWDGEGWVSLLRHRTHLGHRIIESGLTQEGADRGSSALERFRTIIDTGRIYGPYSQRGANAPVFRWKALTVDDVRRALHVLMPWPGEVKGRQALAALRYMDDQPVLPRGNPAWGNRKTHCVNGHEYATARVRPYRARNGGTMRRPSK